MSNEINYSELKDSIITGCDAYLTARQQGTYLEGFYHGQQGITRASKAKLYASKIEKDHLLLELLIAVFNSSSTGLTMCIVSQLFQGDIEIWGACQNDYDSQPTILKEDFKSHVFSVNLLEQALDTVPTIKIGDSPRGPILGVNKRGCARWILQSQAPKNSFFKPLTDQFEADLNNALSAEIDATLLDNSFTC